MPELPEVHALATGLGARITGRVVDRVDVFAFAALKTFDPPTAALHGERVGGVTRHGKFLDIGIGELHLVIHLARGGWIRWRDEVPPRPSGRPGKGPLAARISFAEGGAIDITEAGTTKRLSLSVVPDPLEVPGVERLGPDPLADAFTEEVFGDILAHSGRSQIKGVLRNQSVIAGIGNAYSDEILHVAKMSPFAPASMAPADVARLYSAMRTTLQEAVDRADGLDATELKREKHEAMRVHGRTGGACPICGDTIRQVRFSDSTLQYCPTCQTKGRPLADRVLSRLLK